MAKVLRATPKSDEILACWEWIASALASRKEADALRAAIASCRVRPDGRSRYFLVQGLSNRTARERRCARTRRLSGCS